MPSHRRLLLTFLLTVRPLVYFAPPPGLVRHYEGQWQGAVSRQQGFSASYSMSRPVSTTRKQTSQQAKPLEASPFGLFWGAVAKKEVQVSFSHGQSQNERSDNRRPLATATNPRKAASRVHGIKAFKRRIRNRPLLGIIHRSGTATYSKACGRLIYMVQESGKALLISIHSNR